MLQMREEIEEAKKEKARAYHKAYYKEYQAKNLDPKVKASYASHAFATLAGRKIR